MQFEDYNKKPAESVSQPTHTSRKASAFFTTTTVALSMLAFNIAAFLPAGATPGVKREAKKAKPATVAAKPAVKTAVKSPAKKTVAKAAAKKPATPVAQAPYLPKHRSIWAVKWAAAHPAQEAAFQNQLARRWQARHHLPITGIAKAVPASHPAVKVAAAKTSTAKIAAKPTVKVAAKPVAIKIAAKPVVKAQKPIAKAAQAAIPVAPAALMDSAHNSWVAANTPKHVVKVAAKPIAVKPIAAKPVVKIAVKPAVRPASKAHVRVAHINKRHIAKVAAMPAHQQMRVAAIKSVVASSRVTPVLPAPVKLASTSPLIPTSGEARTHRAAATSLQGSSDVTLDFVSADINDVLKALAVQTGANIVSSADVKGSVTVSLAGVTLDQALDMVARLSGYEYAKVGNTYVVGTASGIQALTGSAVSSTQQVTQVVTFNYASPDDVTSALKQRFPTMQINSGTSISGQKAGAGTKAIILSGDPALISQAKDLVVQIDQSLGANVANESTVAYQVHYAALSDLISILNSLVPALVVTPGPSQGFNVSAPSASASAGSSSSTSTGPSGGGGAPASGSSSSGGGATGGSQSSAIGPSMLLLTGTEGDISRAQQILGQVDIQPKQLLFETKVTEISMDDERKLGVNWDFTGAKTRIGEEPDNIAGGTPTLGENGKSGNILKFGVIGRTAVSDLANVSFNANETDAPSKTLADPNIAAIDGHPAQIFIGDNVNYVSSISVTTTGENVTTASVQVGITFRVTGKVDGDGYITLNLHPEVSTIKDFLQVPGGGELPDVTTRYADTTVRVKDGETIAIGGLIQDEDTESINKVPGLGDLPLIGQLFRFNDHHKTKDQVVFFLKTSVMDQQPS